MQSIRLLFIISAIAACGFAVTSSPDSIPVRLNRLTESGSVKQEATPPAIELSGGSGPLQWASFEEMHRTYSRAFVDSEGFGISRISTFDSPEQRQLWVNGRAMRVKQVGLIGLASGTPVAYKGSWINPRRDQLDRYETRKVRDWERVAIQDIESGNVYVWRPGKEEESSSDEVAGDVPVSGTLMAGLWAEAECMACHQVEKDTLLGAFAYTLYETEAARLNLLQQLNGNAGQVVNLPDSK